MEHSEKKRKLNVIDVIVIVILVAALAFGAYKLLGAAGGGAGESEGMKPDALTEPNIRFTVLCEDLDPALAENVVAALAEEPVVIDGTEVAMARIYNSNQLLDAQIVSCEAGEGEEGTTSLRLTVEANATVTSGTYALLWQEIRIGKEYIVKTLNIEISGVIQSMEKLG